MNNNSVLYIGFKGIAKPEDLTLLLESSHKYCRTRLIQPDKTETQVKPRLLGSQVIRPVFLNETLNFTADFWSVLFLRVSLGLFMKILLARNLVGTNIQNLYISITTKDGISFMMMMHLNLHPD